MRYLIVFLIFIYSNMAHASGGMWPVPMMAPVVSGGGETDTVIGNNSSSGLNAQTSAPILSRAVQITVPAGGMTASHIYFYAKDNDGTATVQFSIFNSSGTLITDCEDTFSLTSSYNWYGGAISTPVFLTAGTYTLQFTGSKNLYYYYTDGDSTGSYGTDGCGVKAATGGSTRQIALVVANYAAH